MEQAHTPPLRAHAPTRPPAHPATALPPPPALQMVHEAFEQEIENINQAVHEAFKQERAELDLAMGQTVQEAVQEVGAD